MYAQVCTHPDLAFVTGMLGKYQSNLGQDHRKAAKKVLRYLQGTKGLMLTYEKSDNLEVVRYSDADFAVCVDTKKIHISLHFHPRKRSYIVEKLQTNCHCIVDNAGRICGML